MKLAKCLKIQMDPQHTWVGISFDILEEPTFYKISDIVKNLGYLLNYRVLNMQAIIFKQAPVLHDTPAIVYYLGL